MNKPDEKTEIGSETADGRVPYEAPRFECEELFEVLALACGKINNQTSTCHLIPTNS